MQLKKRFFNPRFSISFFNWTRQSNKLRCRIQHASRIHASEKFESSAAYTYHTLTHATATRHTTRPHTTSSATLAWLLSLLLLLAARQRDTSLSTSVSSTCQHPMAAVRGIDDLVPAAALAVAFGGSRRSPAPRWPRGRDGGERPACEAHALLEEEARHY